MAERIPVTTKEDTMRDVLTNPLADAFKRAEEYDRWAQEWRAERAAPPLTDEQRALLRLVAEGYRDEAIAGHLGLGTLHVTHAIQQIYTLLDLWGDGERLPRVRAAAWWVRHGEEGCASGNETR